VAMAQFIPLSKPTPFCVPWWSSQLTQLVRNARRARREHRRRPCAEAWRVYLEALSAKGLAIQKAKALHFKQAVANAARGRRAIWPLAKWAKTRSHLPPAPPSITNLVTPTGTAMTPFCRGPVGLYTTGTGGGCSQRRRSWSGTVRRVCGVSPSRCRHSAIKRMRYSVGVDSIGKIANDPPKVGRAIDYVAAAPWPPLGSPGCGWLLCKRLIH
jgi:hypothetical protein